MSDGVSDFYEDISFFDELPFWSAPFGIELLKHLKFRKFIQVLDIGPGTGFPLLEAAQRLGPTCTVFGLEPWQEARTRMLDKIRNYRIKNVVVMNGEAEDMPFEDGTFSCILSNNGLNNVKDIDQVLRECYRVTRPGAQLLFTCNLPGTMAEFYQVLEDVLSRHQGMVGNGGVEDIKRKIQTHIREKRKEAGEWASLVEKHGFRVEDIREEAFSYGFADGTSLLNYHFIRLAFFPSWQELIPEAYRVEVFSEVEKQLNDTAAEKGAVSLTVPFACYDCSRK